ncbi:hypothetical protein OPS25_01335 [Alteromonas ponticola]|uniref:Uncharacterized protein n=1 Tax=Alteromonas aquimaris TaxID=2998417 RepID=A0ABT3P3L6_9ALTE|nr:hypothetical protein [Alteromonas aquimaris]MCW8107145.1 hypothetical protein [Alteromonas aquimaris]
MDSASTPEKEPLYGNKGMIFSYTKFDKTIKKNVKPLNLTYRKTLENISRKAGFRDAHALRKTAEAKHNDPRLQVAISLSNDLMLRAGAFLEHTRLKDLNADLERPTAAESLERGLIYIYVNSSGIVECVDESTPYLKAIDFENAFKCESIEDIYRQIDPERVSQVGYEVISVPEQLASELKPLLNQKT